MVQQALAYTDQALNIYQRIDAVISGKKNAQFLKDFLMGDLKSEINVNIDFLQTINFDRFSKFSECKKDTSIVCKSLKLDCISKLRNSNDFNSLRVMDNELKKKCKSQKIPQKFLTEEIRNLCDKVEALRKISTLVVNPVRQKNPKVNVRLKTILKILQNISEILN